jgi:hypothetical protein
MIAMIRLLYDLRWFSRSYFVEAVNDFLLDSQEVLFENYQFFHPFVDFL